MNALLFRGMFRLILKVKFLIYYRGALLNIFNRVDQFYKDYVDTYQRNKKSLHTLVYWRNIHII